MTRALFTDLLREIRHSFGRYLAIFSIVLIGVAFFAGVSAGSYNMKATAGRYFTDNRMQDLKLLSTVGFTDDDIDAIRKEAGVQGVYAARSLDVMAVLGQDDNEFVTALHSIPEDLSDTNSSYLNRFRLMDGRLPSAPDECTVRVVAARKQPVQPGDVLRLSSGTKDPLSDSLNVTELKVVGLVYTPESISFDLGSASVGDGDVSCLCYVPENAFESEYYTAVYVSIEGAVAYDTFTDAYFDYIAPYQEAFEDFSEGRIEKRISDIKTEIRDTVEEEVTKEVTERVTEEVEKAVREEIEKETEKEVRKQVEEEIRSAVSEEVDKRVREEIENSVRTAVYDGVREKIGEATRSAVEAEVRKRIEAETRAAVEAGAREQIEKETRAALEAEVLKHIEAETKTAVEAAVRSGIENAVRENLTAAVTAQCELDPMFAYLTPEQKQAAISGIVETQYPAALETAMAEQFEPAVSSQYAAALETAVTGNLIPAVNAALPDALDQALSQYLAPAVEAAYPGALETAMASYFDQAVREAYPQALSQALSANLDSAAEAAYPEALAQAMDEHYQAAYDEACEEAIETALSEKLEETVEEILPEAIETAMSENFEKAVNDTVPEEVEKILPEQIEEIYEEQIEENLSDTDDWKWYVLDRHSQVSFVEYEHAAEQMKHIAALFPLFFFFVAALVCFTTMTRMVDEQRGLVGTCKALGYDESAITARFMLYALSASLSGGIIGVLLGLRIFPLVIINAWGIAYQMPAMVPADNTLLAVIAVVSMTLVVVLAAFFACIGTLSEVPSALMRPKAPKLGKKVILERIPFLWKRFTFTQKVTARNILRYKKRFFMTLAGVAGCTALLVTGFGISDSVNDLITVQFDEIYQYDVSVTLKPDLTEKEYREAADAVTGRPELLDSYVLSSTSGKANISEDADANDDVIVTLTAADDPVIFSDFCHLKDRRGKKEVLLPEKGVLISQTIAEKFDLKQGDTLVLESSEGTRVTAEIAEIIEFHVGYSVFMKDSVYRELFNENAPENSIIGRTDLSDEEKEDFSSEVMDTENISSVSFFSVSTRSIRQMISALSIITLVLIISSGLLSFVVLYNLSNVNISERLREIATIKVLGFYDPEVNAYVYRESITITVLGALVGLGLGTLLHHAIMSMISLESVTFGLYIAPVSYLYSFLLTLVFSLIVSIFINRKLKTIPMVESLKSVE